MTIRGFRPRYGMQFVEKVFLLVLFLLPAFVSTTPAQAAEPACYAVAGAATVATGGLATPSLAACYALANECRTALDAGVGNPLDHCERNGNVSDDGKINFNGLLFHRVSSSQVSSTDVYNWVCGNKSSCSQPTFESDVIGKCNAFITIPQDPLNRQTKANLWNTSTKGNTGVGECQVQNQSGDQQRITLNYGKTYDQAKREEQQRQQQQNRDNTRNGRWQRLLTNVDSVCRKVDKDHLEQCKEKIKNAFNECYDSLAAGNNGGRQDVDEGALIACISQKTGYSEGQLRYLFADSYNSSISNKCDVQGLGWIVCWVSKIIGKTVDGLYSVLETLLRTPSLDPNQAGGKELYKVWAVFKNVANVVLVIVMLVVIYSQVTNSGISNYGIKRLLPRIVVSALLINMSFIICAIIIDLSNIAGASIKDILTSVALPVKPDFNSWSTVVGIALVGATAVIVILNILTLAPIIVSGLFALLMIVVILTARQAILIILVMIAPVAFALNILPSGQKWFERWWNALLVLAMLYPVIGFIFGATQVAAGVISAGAPNSGDPTVIILFAVFCLAVQSIPFFTVPLLLKYGGSIMGSVSALMDKSSKGVLDKARGRVGQWAENKQNVRATNALVNGGGGLYGAVARRQADKKYVRKQHESALKSPTGGAFGEFVANDTITRHALAASRARDAGYSNIADTYKQTLSNLDNIGLRMEVEKIDAAEARWADESYSSQDLRDTYRSGVDKDGKAISEHEKAAAARKLASQGNLDDIHELIDDMSQVGTSAASLEALAQGIERSGAAKSAVHLGPQGTQAIRGGGASVESLYAGAANAGAYTPETLSQQSAKAVAGLAKHSGSSAIKPGVMDQIRKNRDTVRGKPKLASKWSASTNRHADNL